MNTRTYYRNSVLAFPKSAEYGCAIERPYKTHLADRAVIWALAVAFVTVMTILLVEAL